MTPRWTGYVGVDDVDAAVDRLKQLGGAVYVRPTDVSNISRFSVVADPQMAALALVKGLKPGEAQSAGLGATGSVGWHELFAADWEKAFAFYGELFGWAESRQPMSVRWRHVSGVLRRRGRRSAACLPSLRPCPFPSGFTISTSTTSRRRRSAWKWMAAKSCIGPTAVPGGAWIVHCTDPQGALFALLDRRSRKAIVSFERVASPDPAVAPTRRRS